MPRTAVVVEDEPDIRSLITAVLESSGYTVHGTENGLDAVELVRTLAPDVTTLDVNIPGIDGFEVARRVRAFSDTYIIFISAFVEDVDAERGRAAGGDEYLGKPFRPRELRARLSGIELRGESGRRAAAAPVETLTFDDISVCDEATTAAGVTLELGAPEREILRALVTARRRGAEKGDLVRLLGGAADPRDVTADEIVAVERAVQLLRAALRSANSAVSIESLHGTGYRLAAIDQLGSAKSTAAAPPVAARPAVPRPSSSRSSTS
ncbi:response regulator transcription factor [Microbacterium terricola]|uniref:Response regulatory domain-containing protein n=1 Tax=Microbacterium terricola TaxID=344163 RepID=A0ABM8DXS3_9MICO|nr:response regulator transcription factor [Microbacterium terricola]UYK38857.1 response regulator transcription factor [Microbacterium terricola]BDV30447.1 hypothetical protein Microterr_11070 [Microbacterium terricola]